MGRHCPANLPGNLGHVTLQGPPPPQALKTPAGGRHGGPWQGPWVPGQFWRGPLTSFLGLSCQGGGVSGSGPGGNSLPCGLGDPPLFGPHSSHLQKGIEPKGEWFCFFFFFFLKTHLFSVVKGELVIFWDSVNPPPPPRNLMKSGDPPPGETFFFLPCHPQGDTAVPKTAVTHHLPLC